MSSKPVVSEPASRRVPVLDDVYETRFDERTVRGKMAVWREIVRYIGRWIDPTAPVLDIACDAGYFIRHAVADDRWATDIRDVSERLPADVHFVQADGLELVGRLPDAHFGTVFMSNYLEHLENPTAVIEQLRIARSLLRPRGRVIILQPNIRLTGPAYWDFIDHRMPLTERSLLEACDLAGLRPLKVIPRFLPYTTKGRLPQNPILVRAYLAFPPAWRVLGQQTLYVGERAS